MSVGPLRGPVADPGEMRTLHDRLGRAARLTEAHMVPLEAMRAAVAARFGPTPHADPADGGAAARCLLLLESPGPRGDPPRFVSRDNPTGTARNLRRFCEAAGLRRDAMLLWNAVPWTIHAAGATNRAPTAAEIRAGLDLLPDLLARLPDLQVVVLAGRVAAAAELLVASRQPRVTVLRMPHPSPTFVNTAPAVGVRIGTALAQASRILDGSARP